MPQVRPRRANRSNFPSTSSSLSLQQNSEPSFFIFIYKDPRHPRTISPSIILQQISFSTSCHPHIKSSCLSSASSVPSVVQSISYFPSITRLFAPPFVQVRARPYRSVPILSPPFHSFLIPHRKPPLRPKSIPLIPPLKPEGLPVTSRARQGPDSDTISP